MGGSDRSSDGIECQTGGLGRELTVEGISHSIFFLTSQMGGKACTHLYLGANIEEGEVSGNEVVGDSSGFVLQKVDIPLAYALPLGVESSPYKDVNLATQDIFCLLEGVVSRSLRPGLDLVESRSEVGRGFGLGTDGVEIGEGRILSLGQRDELVASALNDGKRDKFSRHFPKKNRLLILAIVSHLDIPR